MPDNEKMTVMDTRGLALRLNGNSRVPVEMRLRALTSLFVELCSRILELGSETGSTFAQMNRQDQELMGVIQSVIQKLGPQPTPPPAEVNVAEAAAVVESLPVPAATGLAGQAAAEIAALPPEMRPKMVRSAPAAAPVLDSPAAIAAKMNGSDGVPQIVPPVKG